MARVPVAQRREQLVQATIALAIREGLAAATVRGIAQEAGVSLGIVHYCFASKEALLHAVVRVIADPIIAPVRQSLAAVPNRDPQHLEDVVRAAFRAYWQVVEAAPGRSLLIFELTTWALRGAPTGADVTDDAGAARDTSVALEMYAEFHRAVGELLDAIADATGTSWAAPRHVLARMVVTITDGVTLAWLVDRDSAAALKTLDAFAGQLAALAR